MGHGVCWPRLVNGPRCAFEHEGKVFRGYDVFVSVRECCSINHGRCVCECD